MVGQNHNSIFQQWLAAYGNHLDLVAQGWTEDPGESGAQSKAGSTGTIDSPRDG